MKRKAFIGIETGGTKLQVVAGDDQAKILDRRRFLIDPKRGGKGICDQIESGLAELFASVTPIAAVVGFGGPVDWESGRVRCSHQVEGWSDFPFAEWLGEIVRTPVYVDNDANIAALAEAHQGAGARKNPVFYVTLGSGVGGGLVLDGHIFHGAKPGESEIGHVRLDRTGTLVEQRCSGWAVDHKIRELTKAHPGSKLAKLVGDSSGGEARFMGKALAEQDADAKKILSETAEDLAFGLSHVTHLMHPEVIVLGGGLSLIGEPLRTAVAGHLDRFVMEAFQPRPEVKLSALAEDVVPIGCLVAARQLVKS